MKIAVIHGQSHQGSTYHVTQLLLKQFPDSEITEFKVNNLKPCIGCFNCVIKGEDKCPHKDDIQPIIKAMEASDLIIADSPNYCMGMTGQLKTLFDHMAYRWISHRPHPSMRKKIGVAISTTAGVGAYGTSKAIKKQMFWWGIPMTYRISAAVAAMSWEEVKLETRSKIEKKVQKTAKKIHRHIKKVKPGIKSGFFFNLMGAQQKKNKWNPVDRKHWENNGWI